MKKTWETLSTIKQVVFSDPFYNSDHKLYIKNTAKYLVEALLAVIFEVFRVDIDVVSVDSVWLCELGGVLNKLLHLHSRLVFAQLFKGLNRYIRGSHAV